MRKFLIKIKCILGFHNWTIYFYSAETELGKIRIKDQICGRCKERKTTIKNTND